MCIMRKVLATSVLALTTVLLLTGCVNEESVPTPEPVQEIPTPLTLTVFDEVVREAQSEMFAPNASFPSESPAYSLTSPQTAVMFLSGYSNEECVFTVDDFNVADDVATLKIARIPVEGDVDCGPDAIVKPYALSVPDEIDLTLFSNINVCFEDQCSDAKRLPTNEMYKDLVGEGSS